MTAIYAEFFALETNKVLEAIATCHDAMELLSRQPQLGNIVDASNALGGPITVMEPLLLQVRIKGLLDKIKEVELISEVHLLDPTRTLTGETGQSWYALAKGDLTVTAIKELRSAMRSRLGTAYFDIADARRIIELVNEGKI